MQSQEDLLHFLDMLDLDEEIVDTRLKSLMVRSNYSNKHLASIIQLLLYKNLINAQEDSECDNDEEFDFIVKLLKDLKSDNIDNICKIINIVLCLNKSNLVSKSEHLLQQILSHINCQTDTPTNNTESVINLKLCDSILDAVIKFNEKITLHFLETPLEKIFDTGDENVKIHFLTNTVPKLFEGVIGYNIIDRIWTFIKQFPHEKKENALKVLSCLSEYFLPTPDSKGNNLYISEIIFQYEFWNTILFGLESKDPTTRKLSVYLSKKAIDCVMVLKKNINILSGGETIFSWETNNSISLKIMWDNFFILIDSLEEKQSNIVLPSLKLFESIKIGESWLNCAYNIGLKHENTQIRLKCLLYRLRTTIRNEKDAIVILDALNDINFYDQKGDYKILKQSIIELLGDKLSLINIVKAIPLIKWSPVPFYHITDVLGNLEQNVPFDENVTDILKVACNSIVIRQAVYTNIVCFIKNCCKNLNLIDLLNIFSTQTSIRAEKTSRINQISSLIKEVSIRDEEKQAFYYTITKNYANVDYILACLCIHEDTEIIIIDIINKKINTLQNVVSRQYSNKNECLSEATFLVRLLSKTSNRENKVTDYLHELLARQKKTIIQYIQNLLLDETTLITEEACVLIEIFDLVRDDLVEVLLQLYKTCILLLNDTNNLDKTVYSALTIRAIMKNDVMIKNYKHEMLDISRFLEIIAKMKFVDFKNQSVGRMKNVLYETSCDILYNLIVESDSRHNDLKAIIEFIENVLECGGYGCLKLILKIANKIVKSLVDEKTNFDMVQFLNRTWNEIEELKSNNQYTPCIQEFINLITQNVILEKPIFNNIVMAYCSKILEYGPVRNMPLHYLIIVLQHKIVQDHGHLVYILCEILLYCPVPRKDQRITDNVTLEILHNPEVGIKKDLDVHFNYEIQNLAVATLVKIDNNETLQVVTSFIMNRINETFRNKQRYHGNSQLHKVLLFSLQHLLLLLIKSKGTDLEGRMNWAFKLLIKLPHQPSVRICLEWYISLILYIQKAVLNDQVLELLKSNNVPLTSQFIILYWLLKHKITNSTCKDGEYEFVMDFLLSHTMGQLFNVRLYAQYLATALYNRKKSAKYAYTINIIERTFGDNCNDKNFVKLKNDYFANDFDLILNMSPYFIYHILPRYCGDNYNEEVDTDFVKHVMKTVDDDLRLNAPEEYDFKKEWMKLCQSGVGFLNFDISKDANDKGHDDVEISGTIQKKYIPWKNMGDMNIYDVSKKKQSSSELIVVASLIDKLPNLGGMARTSEVFGVKTYVVDSLRHLQDKQFQGLSVSAERWINVEEVRPGRPLKEYLIKKKSEGYSVVAAEQTSTSCKLQTFKFPKRTLLLLGHEKEGIPCDLLPIMDYCVEIPQQGYVRSLNVHVTAAIFVWEYARQNVL